MTLSRPENLETPRPAHLDVIKLDGHWGQLIAVDNTHYSIKRLVDNSIIHIDPNAITLVRKFRYQKVSDIVADPSMEFSQEMLQNVHWGPEQKEDPNWKGQVNVFGEYESEK